jgi:hypothetical protein
LQLLKLKIVKQIKNKSLNKLDKLIVKFTCNYSSRAGREGEGVSVEEAGVKSSKTGKVAN